MAGVPSPSPKFYDRPGYEFLDAFVPSSYKDIEGGARFWWSWAGILIMFSACHLRPLQQLCEAPITRYLGRISFMLYLTHQLIIAFGAGWIRNRFEEIWGTKYYDPEFKKDFYEYTPIGGALVFFLSWAAHLPPAILLAHWCEVLIDRPSVKFAKWIETSFIGEDDSNRPAARIRPAVADGTEGENAILLSVYSNTDHT